VSDSSKDRTPERVQVVSLDQIDDFPDHPFLVKDDDSMDQLVHSIEMNGVLNPVIARQKEDGRFELISGHRRKHACEKLGVEQIPVIVRDLSRDEAIIEMVDSNLQREHILPSEKARAFKMKMDAMRRQGKRTDLTSSPLGTKLRTDEIVAQEAGESRNQVQRYVRLNELTPELLEFVDEGKIGMRPAVELSYLQEEEMRDLVDYIDTEGAFPSHAQTIRMRELSREGRLDTDTINEIMGEAKGNQKVRIKIPLERIQRYFPDGTTEKQMEDMIVKALAMYRQRQKEERDAR
jgi:ParB family chromosome partitioning protein